MLSRLLVSFIWLFTFLPSLQNIRAGTVKAKNVNLNTDRTVFTLYQKPFTFTRNDSFM